MKKGYIALVAFIGSIPLANWLIHNIGVKCIPDGPCLIPVGFGLMSPSGVLVIGAAFVLRDYIHETIGVKWVLFSILVGGFLSGFLSTPALALASVLAFTFSELADMAVYTPLRKRNLPMAVLASGVVGAILDSALFLYVAFGSFDHIAGNVVGKLWMSVIVCGILMARMRVIRHA